MNIEDYIDKMKEIQIRLLSFIDDENDQEENFENLEEAIKNIQFENNPHKLKSFLYLISKIANNHYRCPNFINKIEKVILIVKDLIKKNFDSITIFNIFRECKLIILFLYEENIMTIDDSVIEEMNSLKLINYKYKYYLINEIDNKAEIKDIDEFKEKRKIGENDAYICKLIREDSIEEFIIYVNKNDCSLNSIIKPSIFETNTFLIKNRTKLIDYAAFFGSVQIFKYLYKNDADVNGSVWFYAVHGNNPELINFLEDNKITLYDKLYVDCFYESVACHHNDMANYIIDNYLPKNFSPEHQTRVIFKYYNFLYFGNNIHNNLNYDDVAFVNACKYDYYLIVDFFVKKNKTILLNVILNIFLNTIQTYLYILMIFTNILIILIAFQINKNLNKISFFLFFKYCSNKKCI